MSDASLMTKFVIVVSTKDARIHTYRCNTRGEVEAWLADNLHVHAVVIESTGDVRVEHRP